MNRHDSHETPRLALVTGGTAGLGRALVAGLASHGWSVITDGRDAGRIEALGELDHSDRVTAIRGDVTDGAHRAELLAAVEARGGRLDLLVHNASVLGPRGGGGRRRELADVGPDDLQHVLRHNVGAPIVLTGVLLPALRAARGILLSISSDAAIDHYAGWGLYSASKAALDHVTLTFGVENPELTTYSVDPGDMRTAMHQDWFPGEDISDRPLPETVVPHLMALLARRPPSGRYRAADLPALGAPSREVA